MGIRRFGLIPLEDEGKKSGHETDSEGVGEKGKYFIPHKDGGKMWG